MQSAESSQKAYEEDEREEREEIASLVSKLPVLNDLFQLHFKIGEGTFSSVFLATLKTSEGVKKFAVKHLVPTCHVGRVERELKCLQNIGGTDHIVGLELCLRNAGSIVFIMPYLKHDRFSEYVYDMDVYETRDYMKALLTALRRVHKFGIIHRDVKPSNFLYDRCNRRYLLVDFGLAQQYNVENKSSSDLKVEVSENQTSKRKRSDENTVREPVEVTKRSTEGKCVCFGKPKICSLCIVRPPQTAPRAGTPGFRAPEVLLKYLFQTPAIDIWASGVMMLSILSGTQPFFRASDDCTALAEITTLFGSNRIQQCARKLGKKINFSENIPEVDFVTLCQKLRKRIKGKATNVLDNAGKAPQDLNYPTPAYDLLVRLLEPDYKRRITAEEALNHPFFNS